MRDETLKQVEILQRQLISVGQMVRNDTEESVKTNDHVNVITHFDHLRLACERIKEAREALKEIEDALSRVNIPEVMSAAGVKTVTIIGVGRATVSQRFSASIIDKDAGFKWLRDNGYPSLITETVNSSTLAGFAKNMLQEEGKDLPPEIFKVGMIPYTSITKVK